MWESTKAQGLDFPHVRNPQQQASRMGQQVQGLAAQCCCCASWLLQRMPKSQRPWVSTKEMFP